MAKIDSKIETSERVNNKDRRFGAAVEYFPVYVIDDTGKKIPALFTYNQLMVAVKRAEVNMEDINTKSSFWDFLFTNIF